MANQRFSFRRTILFESVARQSHQRINDLLIRILLGAVRDFAATMLMSPHEAIGRCDSRTDSRGGDRAADSVWRRTIASLTSDDSRDENQLAKIVAAEVAGLTLLTELVASLRKGTHQSREAIVQSEAIAA